MDIKLEANLMQSALNGVYFSNGAGIGLGNLMLELASTAAGDVSSLVGDVVSSGTGAVTTTIQPNVVANSKLTQMPANTVKGNNTGGIANAVDLTVAQLNTMLGNPGIVTDVIWIDGNRVDTYTATGSIDLPFKTISAALTFMGTAANSAAFQAVAGNRWSLNIAPGTYTESLTIPSWQVINFNVQGVKIIGNVNWSYDGSIVGTGPLVSPKVAFIGTDHRSGYNDGEYPLSSIVGNVTINNTSSAFGQPNFYLFNYSVDGNITTSNTGTGNYIAQIMANNFMLSGNVITTNTTGSSLNGTTSLYYSKSNTSGSYSAGGAIGTGNVPGYIVLSILNDIRFINPVKTNSKLGGRWFHTFFPASSDFTGSAGASTVDSISYASYKANVTPGSETFVFADNASGTTYAPTTSSNWGTVPTTALSALDLLGISGVAKTQTANFVLAGPTTGSAGLPTFRALVSADIPGSSQILALTSTPSSGGAVSEALTVTGLLTSDTILSVTQMTQGGATRTSLPLIGWDTVVTNGLTAHWVADPGVGAVLLVAVKR